MRTRSLGMPVFLAAMLVLSAVPARAAQSAVIEGRVTSQAGRPLENVRVSLLNDTYSPLSTLYTDTAGRFRFSTSGAGGFYVEADALSQPFERQQQRIEVNPSPFSRGGDVFHVDMVLAPIRPRENANETGIRFYQKVPDEARAEYERGLKSLPKDPDAAFTSMRKALELYPDYYVCLETLGAELVKVERLDDAYPLLTHAIELNPAGEMSRYALGVLYFKRSRYAEAAKEFESATTLNAKSANAELYLGLALLRGGKDADAEQHLRHAYEIGAKNVSELHLALTSIYIKTKRNREAAAQLRLLLKEVPNLKDRDKIKALIDKLEKAPA